MSDDEAAERPAKRIKATNEAWQPPASVNAGPADIVLQASDGQYFYCHRAALSFSCELFNSMFDASSASNHLDEIHDGLPLVKVQDTGLLLKDSLSWSYNVNKVIAGIRSMRYERDSNRPIALS